MKHAIRILLQKISEWEDLIKRYKKDDYEELVPKAEEKIEELWKAISILEKAENVNKA